MSELPKPAGQSLFGSGCGGSSFVVLVRSAALQRVDVRTIGRRPCVVPHERAKIIGRGRVHVVAEELELVGCFWSCTTGVTRSAPMYLAKRPHDP